MLKYTLERVVDVNDWDDLVKTVYGKPYSFQQQDGCKERQTVYITVPDHPYDFENDEIPEVINGAAMGVSFKAWLARDPNVWNGKDEDARSVDMFWERNFYPDVSMIANDLHAKGLIEAGDYAINIDW